MYLVKAKLIEQKIGPVKHAERNAKRLAEYLVNITNIDSVTYFIFLDCLHFLAKKNDGINLLNFDMYINKETNQTKIGKS